MLTAGWPVTPVTRSGAAPCDSPPDRHLAAEDGHRGAIRYLGERRAGSAWWPTCPASIGSAS